MYRNFLFSLIFVLRTAVCYCNPHVYQDNKVYAFDKVIAEDQGYYLSRSDEVGLTTLSLFKKRCGKKTNVLCWQRIANFERFCISMDWRTMPESRRAQLLASLSASNAIYDRLFFMYGYDNILAKNNNLAFDLDKDGMPSIRFFGKNVPLELSIRERVVSEEERVFGNGDAKQCEVFESLAGGNAESKQRENAAINEQREEVAQPSSEKSLLSEEKHDGFVGATEDGVGRDLSCTLKKESVVNANRSLIRGNNGIKKLESSVAGPVSEHLVSEKRLSSCDSMSDCSKPIEELASEGECGLRCSTSAPSVSSQSKQRENATINDELSLVDSECCFSKEEEQSIVGVPSLIENDGEKYVLVSAQRSLILADEAPMGMRLKEDGHRQAVPNQEGGGASSAGCSVLRKPMRILFRKWCYTTLSFPQQVTIPSRVDVFYVPAHL